MSLSWNWMTIISGSQYSRFIMMTLPFLIFLQLSILYLSIPVLMPLPIHFIFYLKWCDLSILYSVLSLYILVVYP